MILVYLLSLGIYLITLCPTVYVGDSGEFATAAYTLGITHPPGYPLYVLLGKIFTFIIPYGNIAYRLNIMSAVFGALTCGIVYLVMKQLISSSSASLFRYPTIPQSHNPTFLFACLPALFLAFSKTFWSQSVIAKGGIYTLTSFFIVLLIYISVLKNKNIYLFSFIAGLSIAGHYISGLLLIAFLVFYWKNLFGKNKPFANIIICIFFILLALTILVSMPVRSLENPLMNQGNTGTLHNFIAHIRRVQYKSYEFGQKVTFSTKLLFIKHYFKLAGEQFTYYMLPFVLFGLIKFYKSCKKICILTVGLFLLNGLGLIFILRFQFNPQQTSVVEVYYLPAYTVMAIWLGIGFFYFFRIFTFNKFKKSTPLPVLSLDKTRGEPSEYLKLSLFSCLLILPVIMNFNYNSKRNNFVAYDYSSNIIKSLPKNSHFFSSGDNQMFLLSYQQWCLKKRLDVSFYTDTGLLFKNVYGDDFFQLTKEQKQERREYVQRELLKQARPICFSLGSSFSNLRDVKSDISGIIYKAKPLNVNYDLWQVYVTRGIDNKNYLSEYLLRDVSSQYHYFLAEKYYKDKKNDEMLKEYDKAGQNGGDVEWVYNNIGISLKEKGFIEEAIVRYRKGIEINPYDENIRNNLAFIYLTRGYEKFQINKYEEAKDDYMKSSEASPELAEPHCYLGVLYEKTNQNEAALSEYKKAISLKYYYVDAHYNLGVAYWKIKYWKGVVEEFETVLQLNPAHSEAKKYLAILKK
ncbi:MAG: DUF2723 domain-containing protein [Elusimicrobia bacterium]|nr:DUF2723 domain-containing protein [Elusimicrobiota bacterium]